MLVSPGGERGERVTVEVEREVALVAEHEAEDVRRVERRLELLLVAALRRRAVEREAALRHAGLPGAGHGAGDEDGLVDVVVAGEVDPARVRARRDRPRDARGRVANRDRVEEDLRAPEADGVDVDELGRALSRVEEDGAPDPRIPQSDVPAVEAREAGRRRGPRFAVHRGPLDVRPLAGHEVVLVAPEVIPLEGRRGHLARLGVARRDRPLPELGGGADALLVQVGPVQADVDGIVGGEVVVVVEGRRVPVDVSLDVEAW